MTTSSDADPGPLIPLEVQIQVLRAELNQANENRFFLLGLMRIREGEIAALRGDLQVAVTAMESMRMDREGRDDPGSDRPEG